MSITSVRNPESFWTHESCSKIGRADFRIARHKEIMNAIIRVGSQDAKPTLRTLSLSVKP